MPVSVQGEGEVGSKEEENKFKDSPDHSVNAGQAPVENIRNTVDCGPLCILCSSERDHRGLFVPVHLPLSSVVDCHQLWWQANL